MIIPYIPTLTPIINQPTQEFGRNDSNISNTKCPWFLQDETWAMRLCTQEPDCIDIGFESFIRAVDEMLQSWTRNGYNGFIHRRLYEKGMPTCVHDAFTTLATYIGRTPAIKEAILHIVQDRLFDLARKGVPPITCDAQGILEHLARVQALFVFNGLYPSSTENMMILQNCGNCGF
jgi:hypothetical protein